MTRVCQATLTAGAPRQDSPWEMLTRAEGTTNPLGSSPGGAEGHPLGVASPCPFTNRHPPASSPAQHPHTHRTEPGSARDRDGHAAPSPMLLLHPQGPS